MYHAACLAVTPAEMHKPLFAGALLNLFVQFMEDTVIVLSGIAVCNKLHVVMRMSVFMGFFFNPDMLDVRMMIF